jgi:PAS domain S-box-containing protein
LRAKAWRLKVRDPMKSNKLIAGVVPPYDWVSRVCGLGAMAFGLLALAGCAFNLAVSKSVCPEWITILPNAALGFALLGGGLWLLRGPAPSQRKTAAGRWMAAGSIVIGALSLAMALGEGSFGSDRLVWMTTGFPQWMAVNSAVNLVLLGGALLLLDRGKPQWVQGLGLLVGASVYLVLICFLFGMADGVGIAHLASLHTQLAFLVLAVGVVAAAGDAGFMTLIRNKIAWIFIRRLLPAVLFVPVILSWLRLWGESRGLYAADLGVRLLLILSAVILVTLIVWSAQTVRLIDALCAEAKAEAERERHRLNELMDQVPDRIYFKDREGRFLRNNRAHLARFGLTDPAQALGKTDFDFFPKEHAERAREDDLQVMHSGDPLGTEEKICWPDGRVEWAAIVKMPLRGPDGKILGIFGISHDITSRKQVEQELELMSNRLLLATRAASIGIWDYDPVNNSLVWDAQMFRIFGVDPKRFSGNFDSWRATVHPEDVARETEKVLQTLDAGPEYDSDFRIVWPDGSIRYIKANALVQRDETGRAVHMIGTNWDITPQKRMEEELARSNADLAQFASIASHDLQEPLRAVAGCVELLAKGYRDRLDEDAAELIQHAVEGTRRMQNLIRDLLAYARVDSGGRPLVPTDANAALDEALANLTVTLGERGAVVSRGPLPTVVADPRQLAQLFQNLIANGVKFGGGQRPEIHVSAEMKNGAWQFAVRDNGIGIEPQYLERIFEIFQRLHTRREYPGTGIGLAICKRIVERHRGRIWVESAPEQGSTFYFTLTESPNPRHEPGTPHQAD